MPRISTYVDYLYSIDYKERPVDIVTFIRDDRFLGKITANGKAIYPVWIDVLADVMSTDSILEVVCTGAIGIGKTYVSTIGMSYVIYRILNLKHPWGYFGLSDGGKFSSVFFNLNKSLSGSGGFQLLQNFMLSSPWFLKEGFITGRDTRQLNFPRIEYVLASPRAAGFGTVGKHVITATMDEVDNPSESTKLKAKVLDAYAETLRRFQSRFIVNGETLGKFFLASSKKSEMSFLNTFIKQKEGDKSVYVADVPVYKAKPKTNYSGVMFKVMVGDAFNPPKILDTSEDEKNALKGGFRIEEVPVEYIGDYKTDIVGALRDISGISVEGEKRYRLFPTDQFLRDCFDSTQQNPVGKYTIHTGLKDEIPYIKYFDLSKIRNTKSNPRYIHLDIAFSGNGDALGLAMAGIPTYRDGDVQNPDGTVSRQKLPLVETDFAVRFKASPGDEIPIHKVRKLILDLRSMGFNIKMVSADLKLASADTTQLLEKAGIKCVYLSLDRTPDNYFLFRDLVFENRWRSYPNEFLHFEYKFLEKDPVSGKVDHPDKVQEIVMLDDGSAKEIILQGSKDLADANTGAVILALKNAKLPVDADTIIKALDKNISVVASEDYNYWWLDVKGGLSEDKKGDARASQPPSHADQRFLDILDQL